MECKDLYDFASKAKFKIDIQSLTLTTDNYGGQTSTWGSDGKVWCVMTPYKGKEVLAQGSLQSAVVYSFMIRYKSSYANTREFASKRIVYNGRYFNIGFIRNLDPTLKMEGKDFQEIFATENASEIGTI